MVSVIVYLSVEFRSKFLFKLILFLCFVESFSVDSDSSNLKTVVNRIVSRYIAVYFYSMYCDLCPFV